MLDWKNLKITFSLGGQLKKLIDGRRLQFRIRDRERGVSDWYSIKQTFVRIPEMGADKCSPVLNGVYQMTGVGIDYVAQVSVDGGKSWFPENPVSFLQTQPAADGKVTAIIPLYTNKNLLQVTLRDFPNTKGLPVINYAFSNSVKSGRSARSGNSGLNPVRQNQLTVCNPNKTSLDGIQSTNAPSSDSGKLKSVKKPNRKRN